MRLVLDTNVLVSALLSPRGVPSQILQHWERGYFEVLVCQECMDELARVLRYPKIRKRLASTNNEVAAFVGIFYEHGLWVDLRAHGEGDSGEPISAITADPWDNNYLHLAIAGQAQVIVSGDQYLRELRLFQGVPIMTPAQFVVDLLSRISPDPP